MSIVYFSVVHWPLWMSLSYIHNKLVSTTYKRVTTMESDMMEQLKLHFLMFLVLYIIAKCRLGKHMSHIGECLWNNSRKGYPAIRKYGHQFLITLSDLCRCSTGEDNKLTSYIYVSICWVEDASIAGLFSSWNYIKDIVLLYILELPGVASIKKIMFTCILYREVSMMTL